jgi:hypothetical protein
MRTIRLTSFPTRRSHNFATNPRVAISHVQWYKFLFLTACPLQPKLTECVHQNITHLCSITFWGATPIGTSPYAIPQSPKDYNVSNVLVDVADTQSYLTRLLINQVTHPLACSTLRTLPSFSQPSPQYTPQSPSFIPASPRW